MLSPKRKLLLCLFLAVFAISFMLILSTASAGPPNDTPASENSQSNGGESQQAQRPMWVWISGTWIQNPDYVLGDDPAYALANMHRQEEKEAGVEAIEIGDDQAITPVSAESEHSDIEETGENVSSTIIVESSSKDAGKTTGDSQYVEPESSLQTPVPNDAYPAESEESNGVGSAPLVDEEKATSFSFLGGTRVTIDVSQYFLVDGTLLSFSATSGSTNLATAMSGSMLTLTPDDYWHGQTTILVTAANPYGSTDLELSITVQPRNHPPVLISPIGEVEFTQGGGQTIELGLHFFDIDGGLYYTTSTVDNLVLEINDDTLWITADWCWYGTENFVITASDGEYSMQTGVQVSVAPSWMPIRFPETNMNPSDNRKMPLSTFTDVDIADARVFCEQQGIHVELVDGELIITPVDGWNGEATVELRILSEGGQVSMIRLPVHVSETVRPVMAWLFHYMLATTAAFLLVVLKMYNQYNRNLSKTNPSPVKLSSYKHYICKEAHGKTGVHDHSWDNMHNM